MSVSFLIQISHHIWLQVYLQLYKDNLVVILECCTVISDWQRKGFEVCKGTRTIIMQNIYPRPAQQMLPSPYASAPTKAAMVHAMANIVRSGDKNILNHCTTMVITGWIDIHKSIKPIKASCRTCYVDLDGKIVQ